MEKWLGEVLEKGIYHPDRPIGLSMTEVLGVDDFGPQRSAAARIAPSQ